MSSTTSPNMNLIVPAVGQEPGPQYAFDVNASLTLVDQHDHSPGKGVQITPAGININSALAFNNNQLNSVQQVIFTSQPSASTSLMSLYVSPGASENDLWYTDSNGVQIQITSGGNVNATAASIPGESYAAGTFTWTQTQDSLPTTPANFDIGSITLRPNTALTALGVVLGPPSSISSQYNIALPLVPSVNPAFITMDTSGNMATTVSTVGGITGGNIGAATITGSNIAATTITAGNIANGTITTTQISPTANISIGQQASVSSVGGTFTGSGNNPTGSYIGITGTTLTTFRVGRPVFIHIPGADGFIGATVTGSTTANGEFRIIKQAGAVELNSYLVSTSITGGTGVTMSVPGSSLNCVDFPDATDVSNGSIVYQIQAKALNGSAIWNGLAITAFQV